jgi:hypothetical protein
MYGSFRELIVYQKAFAFAMKIFEISNVFPKEEKFELTDQMRRSSQVFCRANEKDIVNVNILNIFQAK